MKIQFAGCSLYRIPDRAGIIRQILTLLLVSVSISVMAAPDLTTFFPIGVAQQPTNKFATWKGRGINTVVDVPQQHLTNLWSAHAAAQGLYMIRGPMPNAADDIGNANLLAWAHPDEPDRHMNQPPEVMLAEYQNWKSIDPNREVFINFTGGRILLNNPSEGPCQGPICYSNYIQSADWICNDIYPVTGYFSRNTLYWVGQVIDWLAPLSAGRPQFAYIETSDQGIPNSTHPGVTPGEFRAEIWDAIIHGARGIIYFPLVLAPSFNFDGTPTNVVAEMTAQNAVITSLANVLQRPIDPPAIGAAVNFPLEAGWRSTGTEDYFIVLNLTNATKNSQAITLSGISASTATVYGENRTVPISNGVIIDSFAPHERHIYVVDNCGGNNARSGSWAMKGLLPAATSWDEFYQINSGIQPDTAYTASIWVRGSGSLQLRVLNGAWGSVIQSVRCDATSQWQQYTVSFNTGTNTQLNFVLIDAYTDTGGTMYLDDAFLGPTGGVNQLRNAGFENGNTDWNKDPIFTIEQSTSGPCNNHAVVGQIPNTTSWKEFYQINSGIAQNTGYTATIWARGTGSVQLRVLAGSWGAVIQSMQITATSDWQPFTMTFNTGANAQLNFVVIDGYDPGGAMYFDNAFLGVAGGANKLRNSDFENGNTDWVFDDIFSVVEGP
jgi:hypothetical protein